jgi:acetylornithine deacetylase/succinyl-diaminopimelate desuccinylase-like protein
MKRFSSALIATFVSLCAAIVAAALVATIPARAQAPADAATKQLAHDIFKQLIEINTTDSVGNVTTAAEAMAQRLRDAGFPAADIQVIGPNDRKKNMVARLHGTDAHKPLLLICHLDVVEARREDWTMDPFQFIEKDGYFYGRGTEDVKDGDALLMSAMIRMKQEGYKPDRDIILALTADEEGGASNGVDWLLRTHRDLIDAEFILNPDAGDFEMDHNKRLSVGIQASEKLYADFLLEVTNRGGHSSLPGPDNAIYQLSEGLTRLGHYKFPVEFNEVTRAYFEKESDIVGGQSGTDMKAILQSPPDEHAVTRLSATPFYNARLRTTCVATRLEAGHANNALPGFARAIVNCRIFPGHSPDEIRQQLVEILAQPEIHVTQVDSSGLGPRANPPSPLRPDVMGALEKVVTQMWPGVPVIPVMDAGASDGAISRAAGIPTYGVPGVFIDLNDDRSHGRDERLPQSSFYEGVDFYYRFLRALTSAQ